MEILCYVFLFLFLMMSSKGNVIPSFYRDKVQQYSYSLQSTTTDEILFNMCFQTPPKTAAVKAKLAKATLFNPNFNVTVLEIHHDRMIINLEKAFDKTSWNWVLLDIEWIVYLSELGTDWQKLSNGYAYKQLPTEMTYNGAREACREIGAWLPVYGPMADRETIQLGASAVEFHGRWIGLAKDKHTVNFVWENWIEPFARNNWGIGEPQIISTGITECVYMKRYTAILRDPSSLYWRTSRCSQLRRVVCERPFPV
uniref:uncharacterized protein LOC108949964 n=1 Tax=Ciona intestinalis TaxID=7719 RepID=UPI00089DB8C6|nr:uncharacterized protein LOC108949964 [Ciona intestinalis]|eukprot:XP_018669777.1 uncharacterized protein LOC108949964 [Ciona intestinalis]